MTSPQRAQSRPKRAAVAMPKVVMIGDAGVGKTLFLYTAMHANPANVANNAVLPPTMPTIGVDFQNTTRRLSNRRRLTLRMWDTAGEERWSAIVSSYFRSADAVILMYDVSDQSSFDRITSHWLELALRDLAPNDPRPAFVVLANKTDRPERVDRETAEQFAASIDALYLRSNNVQTGGNYARTNLDIIAAHLVRTGAALADDDGVPMVRCAPRDTVQLGASQAPKRRWWRCTI